MKKLSNIRKENHLNSGREHVINFACSQTGLNKEVVTKIYENQKSLLISDGEIKEYFVNLLKPIETTSSDTLIEVLKDVFNDATVDKNELVLRLQVLMNNINGTDNIINMDSMNLISLVKDIIISIDPNSKEVLKDVISVSTNDSDFQQLNESLHQNHVEFDDNTTVQLFESLANLLTKNNKRWGNNNELDTSYKMMMDYFKDTVNKIQLDNDIFHIDKTNELILINSFLSGQSNPILRNFSSAKTQIRDVQTTVFDMILIVSKYITFRTDDLAFVSRSTYNNFTISLDNLVPLFYSSIKESKLLSDEFIRQVFINNKELIGKENLIFGNNNFAMTLIHNIDNNKLDHINQNLYNIPVIGLIEMVNFIDSANIDFNLKMRPLITRFVNSSRELLQKVDRARILKSKHDGNIIS